MLIVLTDRSKSKRPIKKSPKKIPEPPDGKWRRTNRTSNILDTTVLTLKSVDLSPRELYVAKVNCDRSFDDKIPDGTLYLYF